ncbi:hypothetical protein CFC21_064094 [Triticum aestivum]|uniref:Uncharacterized protein n=2 Tax=Triticum aestivum TaxID=4565 RepID=A0A3B6KC46_WHEAT|nr:hypothetical protein CFC21_064094 [Triticum aestivum]
MASISSWSDLPQDLLRLVIARVALPVDRARFRAVCRSWRSVPSPRRTPWLVAPDGFLMRFEDDPCRLVAFPDNCRCIGSTDSWLVMDLTDSKTRTHTYTLENFFSKTTVPFPELDTVIGNVSKPFEVRKVLMRSPPEGLVAVRTNKYSYPIILVQPGKGLWLPQPRTAPYTRLIDIAFLHDRLYGLTRDEDLFSFHIAFDGKGAPTVTGMECIVKHSTVDHDHHEHGLEQPRKSTDDNIEYNSMRYDDDEDGVVMTIWYLVESRARGKLLMVRRQIKGPQLATRFTCKVEVFEADASTSTWVPVSGGLDGHALFVSKRFSRSVFAGGDVAEDTIYFMETGEAYNMRSKTTTPPILMASTHATCLFLPGSLDYYKKEKKSTYTNLRVDQ